MGGAGTGARSMEYLKGDPRCEQQILFYFLCIHNAPNYGYISYGPVFVMEAEDLKNWT